MPKEKEMQNSFRSIYVTSVVSAKNLAEGLQLHFLKMQIVIENSHTHKIMPDEGNIHWIPVCPKKHTNLIYFSQKISRQTGTERRPLKRDSWCSSQARLAPLNSFSSIRNFQLFFFHLINIDTNTKAQLVPHLLIVFLIR